MARRKTLDEILRGEARFGRLAVLGDAPSRFSSSGFEARCARVLCDCGVEKVVRAGDLRSGYANSCGCLQRELVAEASKTRNASHGESRKNGRSPEYLVWQGMIQRCHNPNYHSFADYGGRGIFVCDRWRSSFQAFVEDMGRRPHGLQIERMNNDGPYHPDNCSWASATRQGNNRRSNVILEIDGRRQTVVEWAREVGAPPFRIYARVKDGWSHRDAVYKPGRSWRRA